MSEFRENEKIKILIVMQGAGLGGVESAIGTLCKYLNKERVEITVAVPGDGPFADRLKSYDIKVVKTHMEWWTPASWEFGEKHYYRFLSSLNERVNRLADIIGENEINVVHSSTLTVLDGAIAAMVTGRPHIWDIRGHFEGNDGSSFGIYLPIQTIYNIADSLSTRFVAVSHSVKRFLLRYLPGDKIDVIHDCVDLELFEDNSKKGAHLDEDFPGLEGKFKVALVGRISPVKGVEDFVEAAALVAQKRGDAGFVIVGPVEDEALFEKVKTAIKRRALSDRIVFTGRRKDVPALMQEIDLLVCSSLSEGLPNSCLEAMAASKAVVATRCGGAEELIVNGENGYLVPVGNHLELAQAILKAIEEPKLLELMGVRGKEMAITQFGANVCAGKYEALYLQMKNQAVVNPLKTTPWNEVFLQVASNLGQMGNRTLYLEREVRDLRSFEALFKNNVFYRGIKKMFKRDKAIA
jgi:glycosyltransferase involved in cell wall biosynthesis